MAVHRIEIENKPGVPDPLAEGTRRRLSEWLRLTPSRVRTRTVYHLDLDIDADEAQAVLGAILDPVSQVGAVGMLPDDDAPEPPLILGVSLLPGVTDAVGRSVKTACEDRVGRALSGHAYASTLYF